MKKIMMTSLSIAVLSATSLTFSTAEAATPRAKSKTSLVHCKAQSRRLEAIEYLNKSLLGQTADGHSGILVNFGSGYADFLLFDLEAIVSAPSIVEAQGLTTACVTITQR